MKTLTSGGFSSRDTLTQSLIQAVNGYVLTEERYFRIETGIEHRFGDDAEAVHRKLYNSMVPTTDLLRYFPDSLYFDRCVSYPTGRRTEPKGWERLLMKTPQACLLSLLNSSIPQRQGEP